MNHAWLTNDFTMDLQVVQQIQMSIHSSEDETSFTLQWNITWSCEHKKGKTQYFKYIFSHISNNILKEITLRFHARNANKTKIKIDNGKLKNNKYDKNGGSVEG